MIRDLAKRVLRRLVADAPHIPSAPPTTRERPTRGQAPRPEPEPTEEAEEPDLEVDSSQVQGWLADGRDPLLLDIREPHELWSGAPLNGLLIPMNQVPGNLAAIPRDRPVVVICAAGVRSYGVAHYLREQGVSDAWSLSDGFGGLVEAGHPYHQPPSSAPVRLTQELTLHAAFRQHHGLTASTATVQRIEPNDKGGWRVDVHLVDPERGPQRLDEVELSEVGSP